MKCFVTTSAQIPRELNGQVVSLANVEVDRESIVIIHISWFDFEDPLLTAAFFFSLAHHLLDAGSMFIFYDFLIKFG